MSKIYTVVAAGGLGTRLKNYKNTDKTKMLLEINGVSMITKQIKQLISWNLENFIIVTNPTFDNLIKDEISRNFSNVNVQFCIQNEQLGVAHALLQAEHLIEDGSKILYILGDNFFELNPLLNFENLNIINSIFLKEVINPENFGVIEIFENNIKSIEEKPKFPKSNLIAVGLYLFDFNCFEYIKYIEKSSRGEYEITSLIEIYLSKKDISFSHVEGWWIDAGTPEAIEKIEKLI
tara:strand:+ start:442 stop:1146 length:705 start_codon:yes stop_codon:yes gene_type:complete